MERDYYDVLDAVVTMLRADPAFNDDTFAINVIDALEPIPADQMPAVRVRLGSSTHRPLQITGGYQTGQPDQVTLMLLAECCAFSAQSPLDAQRQSGRVAKAVRNAVRANFRLDAGAGPVVDSIRVGGETFGTEGNDQTQYALTRVELVAQLRM